MTQQSQGLSSLLLLVVGQAVLQFAKFLLENVIVKYAALVKEAAD